MKLLDIVIPAHNEEGNLFTCVQNIIRTIDKEFKGQYNIIIVNDNSSDGTQAEINSLRSKFKKVSIKPVKRIRDPGFGRAIKAGLKKLSAKYFCLVMADASDDPKDIRKVMRIIRKEDVDAVFTNRFKKGGKVINYPKFKMYCNRFANLTIAALYFTRFTDLSNAFKVIKSSLIKGKKLKGQNFELILELALTALTEGKVHKEVPISWIGREKGVSKFRVLRQGPTYLYNILRFLPARWGIK